MMENLPFLSILIALPLIGALAILLLARGDDETVARNAKQVALANSVVVFLLSLLLWTGFDRQDP
ncbi:MAG: NADH-quinone oxidoreductase subunit M, partial [Pseudomonadota bacterium]|nr:NADH-quinone oxidoreductase subunit M [Pseudomonadota bacterium]